MTIIEKAARQCMINQADADTYDEQEQWIVDLLKEWVERGRKKYCRIIRRMPGNQATLDRIEKAIHENRWEEEEA